MIKKSETELAQPGALERPQVADPALAEVIDQYVKESNKEIGRTNAQVLRAIKGYGIAILKCSQAIHENTCPTGSGYTGFGDWSRLS